MRQPTAGHPTPPGPDGCQRPVRLDRRQVFRFPRWRCRRGRLRLPPSLRQLRSARARGSACGGRRERGRWAQPGPPAEAGRGRGCLERRFRRRGRCRPARAHHGRWPALGADVARARRRSCQWLGPNAERRPATARPTRPAAAARLRHLGGSRHIGRAGLAHLRCSGARCSPVPRHRRRPAVRSRRWPRHVRAPARLGGGGDADPGRSSERHRRGARRTPRGGRTPCLAPHRRHRAIGRADLRCRGRGGAPPAASGEPAAGRPSRLPPRRRPAAGHPRSP